YVQNRVLVVKPHFKTPYELFKDRSPALSFMRPFGFHVTILNTLDQLGKFDRKSDERIFVGYFTISKSFRVYNTRTRKHGPSQESECDNQARPNAESSTKTINIVGPSINTANASDNTGSLNINTVSVPVNTATPTYDGYPIDPFMSDLEDTGIFDDAYDDRDEGAEADYNNLKTWIYLMEKEPLEPDGPLETKEIGEGFSLEIKPGWLFLAYASFMDFTASQMDVKTVFLYGTIEEEVYVNQPPGFVDPKFLDMVYKVEKALYGLHQAPRASVKSASTPIETHKPLTKDAVGTDVDVHLYSDYAGASLDRKSTTGGCQFLGLELKGCLINDGCADLVKMLVTLLILLVFLIGVDSVERANTADASLVAAQDSDNINKTQTTTMPNVDLPQGMDTGGSPRRQETMRGTPAQTRSERVLKQPNEAPLLEGHTSESGEGKMEKPFELTDTVPPTPMIHLSQEHSPKHGRMIGEIDKDESINLVSEQGEVQETDEPLKDDDATLAETLQNIKRSTTKDKGKGIMQETELPRKIKKREMIQLSLDEELAQKLCNVLDLDW
nr:ribonuclease H-like domain-containing protein [Tanacetum cinerariifolium]